MTRETLKIPEGYAPGYRNARKIDPDLADSYIAHAYIGDPAAGELIEVLSGLSRTLGYRYIQAGMNQDSEALKDAPDDVREFFVTVDQPPDWALRHGLVSGILKFHRNSGLIMQALVVGSLVEGFSSNIARSFDITGRLRGQVFRRLEQNNPHIAEDIHAGWPGKI